MKNFCAAGESLVHFNDIGETTLEQDKELYQYSYGDIQQMLLYDTKSTDMKDTIRRFWDMFIVEVLNGNFDRHGGSWGFIKKNGKYRIAPVYMFPTSQVKLNGRKSSYYEIISSLQFGECNNALRRIVERFDLQKIEMLIDNIDGLTDIRKKFYKTMYRQRFENTSVFL